ncbi:hypothetical protein Tco_0891245 [Tanacetum coccineum]|uniref:Uncharacterized protein n=1 Tax=Tanacetum coccineum TaxID=301880 RepID=A0ABQ5C3X0_9ASTR
MSPCKTRPASDRPSYEMRIKEPKPKKTALLFIKPKDEPVKYDTTQTEVPLGSSRHHGPFTLSKANAQDARQNYMMKVYTDYKR